MRSGGPSRGFSVFSSPGISIGPWPFGLRRLKPLEDSPLDSPSSPVSELEPASGYKSAECSSAYSSKIRVKRGRKRLVKCKTSGSSSWLLSSSPSTTRAVFSYRARRVEALCWFTSSSHWRMPSFHCWRPLSEITYLGGNGGHSPGGNRSVASGALPSSSCPNLVLSCLSSLPLRLGGEASLSFSFSSFSSPSSSTLGRVAGSTHTSDSTHGSRAMLSSRAFCRASQWPVAARRWWSKNRRTCCGSWRFTSKAEAISEASQPGGSTMPDSTRSSRFRGIPKKAS
mmetsp:Transcript_47678/g.113571  ORF Transcript_47678/g.113571 Transcript_47678/m.113571 type:complete len:284 (+) Transcript_47678:2018-2869(+)